MATWFPRAYNGGVTPPVDADLTGDFFTNTQDFFSPTVVNFGLSPYTCIFSQSTYMAFNSPMTITGKTFTTGYALVYIANNAGGLGAGHLVASVSIKGVAATLLKEVSDHSGQFWGASVTAGVGDIVITGDGFFAFGMMGVVGGILVGMNNTPTQMTTVGPTNYAQPLVTAVVVPTDGVAVCAVGASTGPTVVPCTWPIVSMRRDAVAESYSAEQNTMCTAGAHTYIDGAVTISAQGTGNGWGFNGAVLITLVFGP